MFAALILALAVQDDPYGAHLRNVYLERREAFLTAWEGADEPRRALVREVFQSRRNQGVPALYQLSAQLLTELVRVLDGEVSAVHELSWADRFACTLDLLVLPGAFSASEGGRGDEIIVRVLPAMTRLFEPLPEEVLLRLVWIGPDGQEIPARQEPVHRAAFRMPGFEMYLRAPSSKPGRWWLAPEIEHEGVTGRGFPVPVDCVRDLFGRADRLETTVPTDPHAAAAQAALWRHLRHGVRDGMAPPIDDLLDGALLPPLLGLDAGWAGAETLRLRAGPQEPREIVLVVAPALEDADWVFTGTTLEGWIELAVSRRARVYVTALPIQDGRGVDVLGVLAGLRILYPDLPLTLVVRGPSVGRLALARMGKSEPVPFDRVVVHTVLSPKAKPRCQFDVPTLLLTPLAETRPLTRVPDDGPPLFWRQLLDPPLVIDQRLAKEIEAWLETLDELDER
jgi:hypothetical protein